MLSPRKVLTPRRNARLEGSIVFGRTSQPCIVKSVSETEAKLEVASVAGVPNTFDLILPDHRSHHYRVVWRSLKELGVVYRDK